MTLQVLHKIAYIVQSLEMCQKKFSLIMLLTDSSAACVGHPGPALDKPATGKEGNPVGCQRQEKYDAMTALIAASHQIAHCSSRGLQSLNMVAGRTWGDVCISVRFHSVLHVGQSRH